MIEKEPSEPNLTFAAALASAKMVGRRADKTGGLHMPPLHDQRLERFARALAKGSSPFAALVEAGWKGSRAEAESAAVHPNMTARVAELQVLMAQETVTTPEKQFEALEAVRQLAMARRHPSGAISAIMQKAQLLYRCNADPSEGQPREPITKRENAVSVAKTVRLCGFQFKSTSRGAQKFEAMVDQLLKIETTPDAEDVVPRVETTRSTNNRIPALIQLLKELGQARELAMVSGKTGAATRAVRSEGKLQEQLTRAAAEREQAEDSDHMSHREMERRFYIALYDGIEDPDGILPGFREANLSAG